MQLPNIVYPKLIKVNGYTFQVAAYCQLTDEQALKVVLHYLRTHKMKKVDKNKVFRILTQWDINSVGVL